MGFYCKCFRFEGGGRQTLGLKRTGKSCRLRWVNYLHPGLKRGKMTPHEEKLVLELHSQYGNRWSRIARKLPGRTDNEIKNYWRTHMRKKAQQKKLSSSSPSSNSSSSSLSSGNLADSDYKIDVAIETTTPTTTTTPSESAFSCLEDMEIMQEEVYSMDEIWKDISSSGEVIKPMCNEQATIASPLWEYDSLWQIDGQESRMFNSPFSDAFLPC